MPYAMKVALRSLWRERWINLLSILTIAMGLLVLTLIVLFMYNLNLFTKRLPERFSVVAYLKEGISEQDTQEIIASLKRHRGVEKVTYTSKAEALRELKASMKSADYILEGLNENPLPASIEIRLKREVVGPESVKSFVSDIRKIPGMEDIQYGEKFLVSLHSLKTAVQTAGLILTVIMAAGIIFICYSTVKILFYRRREEIETLKLLGATKRFIRLPFLVEGGVIGAAGGGISLIFILAFYAIVVMQLTATAPLFGAVVFPQRILACVPGAGLFLGIAGAFIAIGRIKF